MNNLNVEEVLAKYDLKSGSHDSLDKGACIMELVSYIANEPWSDHPKCACPILTEYAIRLNDKFNDEHRQLLKPMIVNLLNSRVNDATQVARKRLIRWRYVTHTYPMILECWKLPEHTAKLRTFENTLESMAEAKKYLEENRKAIRANAAACAYAYAYAAANAYADADAYAYAYADAYAYAYADACANAYADAYADADADAFRSKVVESAIETLRLACEVRIDEPKSKEPEE